MHNEPVRSTLIRDRWYIAAFSEEVSRTPLERTIFGDPVVLYRTEAGEAVAMFGLCPHRFYPLARGELKGDSIVCGYHGFEFDRSGKCVFVPSQGTGTGYRQPVYTVVEQAPLIWIWIGEQARCDPALIPPYAEFQLGEPGWKHCAHTRLYMRGRYELLIDNVMDLSHVHYLHGVAGDSYAQGRQEQEQRARSFRLTQRSRVPWNDYFAFLFSAAARFEGLAQVESVTDFYGPELIRTSIPVVTAVEGSDSVPDTLGRQYALHGITPETEHSTHYFGLLNRNFRLEDEGYDDMALQSSMDIRQQDIEAIEAIEGRFDEALSRQPMMLVQADRHAIKVRGLLDRMREAALP